MYFQQGHQLPDKQVSDRRGEKQNICLPLSESLIDILSPLSSAFDDYTKGICEASEIIYKRALSFLYHHDIIFKFSSEKHQLQKISNNLYQYTGISWVWVA